MKFSIVIPAYNESARLLGTLTAVTRFFHEMKEESYEVIVVDDGSNDDTVEVASRFAVAHQSVRVCQLGKNCGKGAAVRRGVLESRGDYVLYMDADLATPMGQLDKLHAELLQGADVAIGSRAIRESVISRKQSAIRQNLGRSFNKMVQLLVLSGIKDTQCGFKLFTASSAKSIFSKATVDRFAFDVEILILADELDYKIVEVPVEWAHVDQSKVSPLRDATRMAWDILWLSLKSQKRKLLSK